MAWRASDTQYGTVFIVAVEQTFPAGRRLIQDGVAYFFLPKLHKLLVNLSRSAGIRELMIRACERQFPGAWAGIAARKRYIDDRLTDALDRGIGTVVNLGAGLDTRAYRFASQPGVRFFEVDLPQNIEFKRARVEKRFGQVPGYVTLVPIDLDSQALDTVMASCGYKADQRTFFIWEGVTQYLTEEGVRRTFEFLAKAGQGSELVFSYVLRDFIDGHLVPDHSEGMYQRMVVKDQVWRFGMDPADLNSFLEGYGWREVEQWGSAEATARYVRPINRTLPVAEIERLVYAENRNPR